MSWGLDYLFEEISKLTNVKIRGISEEDVITEKMLQRIHAEIVKVDPDNVFAYPAYLVTMEKASRYVALPSHNRISQDELAKIIAKATGISDLSNHNNGILAAIAIMRFQDMSGACPEVIELTAEVLSILSPLKEAPMPKVDLCNIYFGDSLETYISNLIVPATKNYAAIRAAYSKGHVTCDGEDMEEIVGLFSDLNENVQEELFAMVASNVSNNRAIDRARSEYAFVLYEVKNKVNDFIVANGDLIVEAFGLQTGLYSYDELRTLLALAVLSYGDKTTHAPAMLVENAFRNHLVSPPTAKKAKPERVTTTPKTQTVKEIPMQTMPTTITRNKDAMIHAARLEAGKTSITVLKALLKKSKALPMAFRGYIDHPIADILLANLLVLTSKQVNNEKLSALADASMDASYVALAGSLNIQEMIEGFLATPEIANAIKAIEPKKD